jgi:hypothetical protein
MFPQNVKCWLNKKLTYNWIFLTGSFLLSISFCFFQSGYFLLYLSFWQFLFSYSLLRFLIFFFYKLGIPSLCVVLIQILLISI